MKVNDDRLPVDVGLEVGLDVAAHLGVRNIICVGITSDVRGVDILCM